MKSRRSLIRAFVLLCVGTFASAAVLFLGLEVVLRIMGWKGAPSPYGPRSVVHHVTDEFDVVYRCNDRGFRDERNFRELEQSAGVQPIRVVAIGDSFTEGFGVASTVAWPTELEKILRRKNPSAQVLNLGISGGGPNEYFEVFEYALGLHPSFIVVGFFVGNEAAEARKPVQPPRSVALRWLSAQLHLVQRRLNSDPFGDSLLSILYRWKICRENNLTTRGIALIDLNPHV